MKGDIVVRQGSYLEIVMEESGSTRLIMCCDFKEEEAQPLKVRHYRVEHWDSGQIKRQTSNHYTDALALFHLLIGGKPETDMQKRLFSLQLSDRIDSGLCIHCGTSENVIRALCVECRTLPRFQEVLGNSSQ